MVKGGGKKIRGGSEDPAAATPAGQVPADVIIPAVAPPPDRVGRYTNQLKFMRFSVLDTLSRMPEAAGFKLPVDPFKLQIPNYYDFIKRPMDFATIRKRIINKYYYSAKDCLRDFQQVFANAYVYNRPPSDVIVNANKVELTVMRKLMEMPEQEVEIDSLSSKDWIKDPVVPSGGLLASSTPPSASAPIPAETVAGHALRPRPHGSGSSPGTSMQSPAPSLGGSSPLSGSSASSSSSSSGSDSDEEERETTETVEIQGHVIPATMVEVWKQTQLEYLTQQMALIQQQMTYVASLDTKSVNCQTTQIRPRKRGRPSKQKPTPPLPLVQQISPGEPLKKKPKVVESTVKKPAEPTQVVVKNGNSSGASAIVVPKVPPLKVRSKAPETIPDKTKPMTPEEMAKLKKDINSLVSEDFDEVVTGITLYTDELDEDEGLPIEKCPVHYQWELYELVAEKLRTTSVRYEDHDTDDYSPQCNMPPLLSPVGSFTLSLSPSPPPSATPTPSGTPAIERPLENTCNGSATTQPVDDEDDGGDDDDYDESLDFY